MRVEGEPRCWLVRQGELELLQDDLLVLVQLGVARQDDLAAVGGRQVDIDHLNGGHFLEHRPWGQAGCERAQAVLEGDLEAIGDEGDKDMGLDAVIELVVDRPDSQVPFSSLKACSISVSWM